jgi:hypothetical protein
MIVFDREAICAARFRSKLAGVIHAGALMVPGLGIVLGCVGEGGPEPRIWNPWVRQILYGERSFGH